MVYSIVVSMSFHYTRDASSFINILGLLYFFTERTIAKEEIPHLSTLTVYCASVVTDDSSIAINMIVRISTFSRRKFFIVSGWDRTKHTHILAASNNVHKK